MKRHRAWLACLALAMPCIGTAQDALPMTHHDESSPAMQNMDMNDNASYGMLLVDQLEFAHGYGGNGPMWEAEAWYGNDSDKLWLRSEGEGSREQIEQGDLEALWSHALSAFWNTELGVRHDLGVGPQRNWAAFGVEGLAPYWLELEATGYLSNEGRVAARMRAEYTLRFTQRLMLQPEFEINLYSKSDPAQRIGSVVSDTQLGLRLRYEITRQFAPYVGVVWSRRFGTTAAFARMDREPVFDRQFVAGIRFWF
ncbi:copper resistance protein B [Dyella nitratireducens]|nr:copper resistance protein B [Dyella nitratireducens]